MKQPRYCKKCGILLTKESQKVYCSTLCCINDKRDRQFEAIERAGKFPVQGKFKETNRYIARAWLEHKYGHVCALCGLSKWLDKPIPLVVDHIDGNPENHDITNVRLICPNCDALLPTYKSRNRTNTEYIKGGRAARKSMEYDRRLERSGLIRDTPQEVEKVICPICGTEFKKKYSSQMYCSKPCVAKALRKKRV